MSLSRIQKTFVRLATNQQSYWSQLGRRKTKRRVYIYNKKWQPNKVTVGIINAVTGEKTTAKAFEESASKLKKWLKLRNVRAEFTDMLLKKRSTWFNLSDEQFIDYPIIIQVGTYRCPYLIKRIQDRVVRKGRVTCSIQLETVDNVNYLEILSVKKELLEKGKRRKK
jgi:hypothetical protein